MSMKRNKRLSKQRKNDKQEKVMQFDLIKRLVTIEKQGTNDLIARFNSCFFLNNEVIYKSCDILGKYKCLYCFFFVIKVKFYLIFRVI